MCKKTKNNKNQEIQNNLHICWVVKTTFERLILFPFNKCSFCFHLINAIIKGTHFNLLYVLGIKHSFSQMMVVQTFNDGGASTQEAEEGESL